MEKCGKKTEEENGMGIITHEIDYLKKSVKKVGWISI